MDIVTQLLFAFVLAIPIACISWTVTQEELFREVREKLRAYSDAHPDSMWRRKLAYAPTCAYCFSHYVAALFVVLLGFPMLVDDWRGYLVSFFAVVLVANVYTTVYHLLRIAVRASKATADRAEANARRAQQAAAQATNGHKHVLEIFNRGTLPVPSQKG